MTNRKQRSGFARIVPVLMFAALALCGVQISLHLWNDGRLFAGGETHFPDLTAEELDGMSLRELPLDENSIRAALEIGCVIASMWQGDFTDSGHFIVIESLGSTGFRVLDPNRVENSETLWSFERLKPQIRNLWGYSI